MWMMRCETRCSSLVAQCCFLEFGAIPHEAAAGAANFAGEAKGIRAAGWADGREAVVGQRQRGRTDDPLGGGFGVGAALVI